MNNIPKSGWKKEPRKFKDRSHRRIYGSAPVGTVVRAMARDISGVPVVFQGDKNTCVACSVSWIKQFKYKQQGKVVPLAQEYLAQISNTEPDGATPSQVLDAARKQGICESERWLASNKTLTEELAQNAAQHEIGGYAYLDKLDASSIFYALSQDPIMIGVESYQGSGPHMMVGYGVSDNGESILCVNWWNADVQSLAIVPFEDVRFAASILDKKPETGATLPVAHVLASKWSLWHPMKKFLLAAFSVLSALIGGFGGFPLSVPPTPSVVSPPVQNPPGVVREVVEPAEQSFGAAGIADLYHTNVSGAGITNTATDIPVSSITLYTNEVLTSTSTRYPLYLIINPNNSALREKVECNALNVSTLTFTQCYRGLSALCQNATSTVSGANHPHAAGEPVIMSNDSCYFNRFLDTDTDQSATGTKTFLNNRIKIGDGATTTAKFIYFLNGQSNPPYFKVVGPAAGHTTSSFYFSQDGTSDLTLNASGTTFGADPSLGLQLLSGLFGINASGTTSNNGGFLSFNSIGQIYWDVVGFLAHAWRWTGDQIFAGNVTSTGILAVQTPTSTMDAVNKSYADNNIQMGSVSGTAAMTLSPGSAVYITTTGTLMLTDSTVATSTYQFIGFNVATTTVGQTATIATPGGTLCAFTGLSAGYSYYLNGSLGQITATGTTLSARVGRAVSSNCLAILPPKFIRSGILTIVGNGDRFAETGFYPSYVTFKAGFANTNALIDGGFSIGDDLNTSIYATGTGGVAGGAFTFSSSTAYQIIRVNAGAAPQCVGSVTSKAPTGFTLNTTNFASSFCQVAWTAWSE
jgi:hypothetical protein